MEGFSFDICLQSGFSYYPTWALWPIKDYLNAIKIIKRTLARTWHIFVKLGWVWAGCIVWEWLFYNFRITSGNSGHDMSFTQLFLVKISALHLLKLASECYQAKICIKMSKWIKVRNDDLEKLQQQSLLCWMRHHYCWLWLPYNWTQLPIGQAASQKNGSQN